MPEVTIQIGGRSFQVACQDGEESYLQAAAKLLDDEAQVLVRQIGRIPESRLLLMAGLMLADKTAGLDDQLKLAEQRIAELETALAEAQAAATQVAEVPAVVTDTLAELAARAEAMAQLAEEKAAG